MSLSTVEFLSALPENVTGYLPIVALYGREASQALHLYREDGLAALAEYMSEFVTGEEDTDNITDESQRDASDAFYTVDLFGATYVLSLNTVQNYVGLEQVITD